MNMRFFPIAHVIVSLVCLEIVALPQPFISGFSYTLEANIGFELDQVGCKVYACSHYSMFLNLLS